MSEGFFDGVKRRTKGTISYLGIAFACAIPGATQAIEQPFLDIADAGRMIAGKDLPPDKDRSGYLTDAVRTMGADTRAYEGQGERQDACEGGQFIGETVGTIILGGPIVGAVRKGVKAGAKAVFKQASTEIPAPTPSEPKGKLKKAVDWTADKAMKYGAGTIGGAIAGGALDATKEIYREEHVSSTVPTPAGP